MTLIFRSTLDLGLDARGWIKSFSSMAVQICRDTRRQRQADEGDIASSLMLWSISFSCSRWIFPN